MDLRIWKWNPGDEAGGGSELGGGGQGPWQEYLGRLGCPTQIGWLEDYISQGKHKSRLKSPWVVREVTGRWSWSSRGQPGLGVETWGFSGIKALEWMDHPGTGPVEGGGSCPP